MKMRKYYDASGYYDAKNKLPSPDGIYCILCGNVLEKGRRKYCSDMCLKKFLNDTIKDWSEIKKDALKRDNYCCVKCGFLGKGIEVHHIKPIHKGGPEFDIKNCISLCHDCHVKEHSYIRHSTRPLSQYS